MVDFRTNGNNFSLYSDIQSNCLRSGNSDEVQNKLLTICITVYKRIDTLKFALDSALNQKTDFAYDIIILDDCPSYEGENPVLKFLDNYKNQNISYFQNSKNLGMGGTWNRCGELSKTPYFSILHDDDLLKDNYVQTVCSYFMKHTKVDCLVNNFETINYPYEMSNAKSSTFKTFIKRIFKKTVVRQGNIPANFFLDNYYGPPTCGIAFKRSSFLQSGGFDQEYYPSLDWYFMIFFSSHYKVRRIRECLSAYVWANNTSLKEETQIAFKNQRQIVIDSLSTFCPSARFYSNIFSKDLTKKNKLCLLNVLLILSFFECLLSFILLNLGINF